MAMQLCLSASLDGCEIPPRNLPLPIDGEGQIALVPIRPYRVRNSTILGLISSGLSWCIKWPVPGMMTFSSPPVK